MCKDDIDIVVIIVGTVLTGDRFEVVFGIGPTR